MKTPAEELGYKVGMEFEVLAGPEFSVGSHVVLVTDDSTSIPYFSLIENLGTRDESINIRCMYLYQVTPLKKNKSVDLKFNQQFTVSRNKFTGCTKYTTEVLTCLDTNELSVRCLTESESTPTVLLKAAYDFAVMPENKKKDGPSKEFSPHKDQLVLVKTVHECGWIQRFSTGRKKNGLYEVYSKGRTSHTGKTCTLYNECKPAEQQTSILTWIEHDGSSECPAPNNQEILVEYESTYCIRHIKKPQNLGWSSKIHRWAIFNLCKT